MIYKSIDVGLNLLFHYGQKNCDILLLSLFFQLLAGIFLKELISLMFSLFKNAHCINLGLDCSVLLASGVSGGGKLAGGQKWVFLFGSLIITRLLLVHESMLRA